MQSCSQPYYLGRADEGFWHCIMQSCAQPYHFGWADEGLWHCIQPYHCEVSPASDCACGRADELCAVDEAALGRHGAAPGGPPSNGARLVYARATADCAPAAGQPLHRVPPLSARTSTVLLLSPVHASPLSPLDTHSMPGRMSGPAASWPIVGPPRCVASAPAPARVHTLLVVCHREVLADARQGMQGVQAACARSDQRCSATQAQHRRLDGLLSTPPNCAKTPSAARRLQIRRRPKQT